MHYQVNVSMIEQSCLDADRHTRVLIRRALFALASVPASALGALCACECEGTSARVHAFVRCMCSCLRCLSMSVLLCVCMLGADVVSGSCLTAVDERELPLLSAMLRALLPESERDLSEAP